MLFILVLVPLVFCGLGYAIGRAADRAWAVWIVPAFVAAVALLMLPKTIGILLLTLWVAGAGMLGTYLGQRARAGTDRSRSPLR